MTQGLDFNHYFLQGSGALAILVMAFTAGTAWRKQGWECFDDNFFAHYMLQKD